MGAVAASAVAFRWHAAAGAEAEPADGKALVYHSRLPANGEPALADLAQNWLTPTKFFYIRSNGPVPQLDPRAFRLSVEGLVEKPLNLSLEELSELGDTEMVATLTCAGNRRREHSQIKHVDGVPWNEGAIGNARWGGVKLSALLERAGLKENARHVWFEGLDEIKDGSSTINFGGSIPVQKAMLDVPNMPPVIVATQMNGRPLSPNHGFPVRAVVPGYIGARSVKWLGRIVVGEHPSLNYYVQDSYKIIAANDKLLLAEAAPIYSYPINAVVCTPTAGESVKAGIISASGYALPSGVPGAVVDRVEVSTDLGQTWTAAKLDGLPQPGCWRIWHALVKVDRATRQLVVRAFDSTGKMQPQLVEWNAKGYLYNAWHRVPVTVL